MATPTTEEKRAQARARVLLAAPIWVVVKCEECDRRGAVEWPEDEYAFTVAGVLVLDGRCVLPAGWSSGRSDAGARCPRHRIRVVPPFPGSPGSALNYAAAQRIKRHRDAIRRQRAAGLSAGTVVELHPGRMMG